jgi:hypothetical protein
MLVIAVRGRAAGQTKVVCNLIAGTLARQAAPMQLESASRLEGILEDLHFAVTPNLKTLAW